MEAYRINLMGTNDHYLVTERQKIPIEKALNAKNSSLIRIANDTVRTSSIKSITLTRVDLDSCPEYFQEAVAEERAKNPAQSSPSYRKLPTEFIIIARDGKILATDIAAETVERITKSLLALGDPEENPKLRFLIAKAHYTTGIDGVKQYYTAALEQIPEALLCFPNAEDANGLIIRQIYHYGIRQL